MREREGEGERDGGGGGGREWSGGRACEKETDRQTDTERSQHIELIPYSPEADCFSRFQSSK